MDIYDKHLRRVGTRLFRDGLGFTGQGYRAVRLGGTTGAARKYSKRCHGKACYKKFHFHKCSFIKTNYNILNASP